MALMFIRTLLLYIIILIAIKSMGKRQIAQLQPFEMVVLLVISEMASLAMQSNTMPLAYSITPIVTVTLLQILVSLLSLKSQKVRDLVCGRPEALVENGRFNEKAMAKMCININDLQELCRAQGYFDLSAVDYAIMETNGSLSILPRTEKRPLQVDDILSDPPEEQLSRLLILDGKINRHSLQISGYDEKWLHKQLRKFQAESVKEIFIAGIDDQGTFFAQKRLTRGGSGQ